MHEVYEKRFVAILSSESPALPAYRAEDDPEWPAWRARSAPEIFERARLLRSRMIDQLLPMSNADFARIGEHGRLGSLPMSMWLEFFLAHEGHHLYQIFRLVREP